MAYCAVAFGSLTSLGRCTSAIGFSDPGFERDTAPNSISGRPSASLLFYSKKLAMEAAMDVRGEQYAWAAHYLCEMGKAVVDDLTQAMTPRC